MPWPVTRSAVPVSLGWHQSGVLFIYALRKRPFLLRAISESFVFLNTQEQEPIYKTQVPFDRHKQRGCCGLGCYKAGKKSKWK